MHGAEVVVEQPDVAARHLQRGRAVAEDALEREDVAPVGQERPREAVAEDVRRAAPSKAGRAAEAPDEQLDGPRRQACPSTADEQRIVCREWPAGNERHPDGAPRSAAERDHPLPRPLAHDAAAPFDEVDVPDRERHELPEPEARVEQQEHDRPVADHGLGAAIDRSQQRPHLRSGETRDQDVRNLGRREPREGVHAQPELALQPVAERAQRADAASDRVRRQGPEPRGLGREQPASSGDGRQVAQGCRLAVTRREPCEVVEVRAVPVDRAAAAARDLERGRVLLDEFAQRDVIDAGERERRGYRRHHADRRREQGGAIPSTCPDGCPSPSCWRLVGHGP